MHIKCLLIYSCFLTNLNLKDSEITNLKDRVQTFFPFFFSNSKDSNEAEDNKSNGPSWEKQEAMVKRLQKRFPDQDKEVNAAF